MTTVKKDRFGGFTLVELLVVIAILAILGLVAYTSFSGSTEKAQDSRRISDLTAIRGALELYKQDTGKYPIPANWSAAFTGGITSSAAVPVVLMNSGSPLAVTNVTALGRRDVVATDQHYLIGVVDASVLPSKYLDPSPRDPFLSSIKGTTGDNANVDKYLYAVDCGSNWDNTTPTAYDVTKCTAVSYQLAAVLYNKGTPKLYVIGNGDQFFGTGYVNDTLTATAKLYQGSPALTQIE